MRRVSAQRGVTLVELLVTIVLAGIAFAALVPVFVLAQRTGSGDKARVVAMNVAQSHVELIRDLSYDQITQAQLPTQSETAQGKSYTTTYTVEYVYQIADEDGNWTFQRYLEGAPDRPSDAEAYKLVTVDVVWQGPPTPAKHAVLKTAIYRQILGSQIARMTVAPLTTLPSGDTGIMTSTGPVTLTVDISPLDWGKTRSVTFIVQGPDGRTVSSGDVNVDWEGSQSPVSWSWAWTSDARPVDGIYTFMATAKDDKGDLGNTWRLWYPVETGPPPAPKDVYCIRGRNSVIVQWTRPDTSDLTGYEVSRLSPSPPQTWSPLPIWTAVATADDTTYPAAFIDRMVSETVSYQYVVRARDLGQVPSVDSTPPASAGLPTEAVAADQSAPNAPTGLQLTNSLGNGGNAVSLGPAVAVSWTGSNSGDVRYYAVYRDADWNSPLAVVPCSAPRGTFSVTDRKAGWGSTHTYTIRAMDAALNESGDSATATIAVPPAPVGEDFDLRIEIDGPYGAQVTIESLADYLSYPMSDAGNAQNPRYVEYLGSNGNRTWRGLPYGMYRIRIVFDGPAGASLDARSVIEDIELFQNTTREYSAPN